MFKLRLKIWRKPKSCSESNSWIKTRNTENWTSTWKWNRLWKFVKINLFTKIKISYIRIQILYKEDDKLKESVLICAFNIHKVDVGSYNWTDGNFSFTGPCRRERSRTRARAYTWTRKCKEIDITAFTVHYEGLIKKKKVLLHASIIS
jgi:hypothetical protein